MTDLVQVIAELTNEGFLGAGTGQEPAIGRQRIEGAKESQALDEVTTHESTGTIRSVLSLPSGT